MIGCGGTNKPHTGEETVWNNDPRRTTGEGTGGGYSTLFPMPSWQAGAPHGPGRMVPDVAGNADPNTGYEIILYGAATVVGGTSAVAPLYAGLFASFGTKLGFITPELYLNSACFTDITRGDNGAFRARTGVDPCTGLGSPFGEILEERIHPAALDASRVRMLLAENAQLRASAAQARQSPCPGCQQTAAYSRPAALVASHAMVAPRLSAITPGPPGTYARTIYLSDGPHVYVWDCDGHMIAQEDFRPC